MSMEWLVHIHKLSSSHVRYVKRSSAMSSRYLFYPTDPVTENAQGPGCYTGGIQSPQLVVCVYVTECVRAFCLCDCVCWQVIIRFASKLDDIDPFTAILTRHGSCYFACQLMVWLIFCFVDSGRSSDVGGYVHYHSLYSYWKKWLKL